MVVQSFVSGDPIPILEAQAQTAFSRVPAETLETLLQEDFKIGLPADANEMSYLQELQLLAVKKTKPLWTQQEAALALRRGFLEEEPEATQEPFADLDSLCQLLTTFEADCFKKHNDKVCNSKAGAEAYVKSVSNRINKYFKPSVAAKAAAKKPKMAKPPRMAMPANPKVPEVTAFIKSHVPSEIHIKEDFFNGRWRIVSPHTNQWKSISWSTRGFQLASELAVFQAWEFYTGYTLIDPPFSMDALAKEISDTIGDDDE